MLDQRTEPVTPAATCVLVHDHTCPAMGPGLIVVYTHPVDLGVQSVIIDELDGVLTDAVFHEVASPSVARSCMYVGPGLAPGAHDPDRAIWVELPEGFNVAEALAAAKRIVRPFIPYTATDISEREPGGTAARPRMLLSILDKLDDDEIRTLWEGLEGLSFVHAVGFNHDECMFTLHLDGEALREGYGTPASVKLALETVGIFLVPVLPHPN